MHDLCCAWMHGSTMLSANPHQMPNILNLFNLIVVKLQLGEVVQSLQVVNLGQALEAEC